MITAAATCPNVETLKRFALGQVAEADLEPLAQHLAQCRRCLEALPSLPGVDSLVEAMRAQNTLGDKPRNTQVDSLIERLKQLPLNAGHSAPGAG